MASSISGENLRTPASVTITVLCERTLPLARPRQPRPGIARLGGRMHHVGIGAEHARKGVLSFAETALR